jgi:sec-independent protein translocase protein TatA
MLSDLKGWEFLILAGLVVLLFGGKRLPDAARGLGRSLRIFKSETRGLREDDEAAAATTTVQQVAPAPPVAPVVPPAPVQPAEPVTQQPAQPSADGGEH